MGGAAIAGMVIGAITNGASIAMNWVLGEKALENQAKQNELNGQVEINKAMYNAQSMQGGIKIALILLVILIIAYLTTLLIKK